MRLSDDRGQMTGIRWERWLRRMEADVSGIGARLRRGFRAQPSLLGLPAFAEAMAGWAAEALAKAGFRKNVYFCFGNFTS